MVVAWEIRDKDGGLVGTFFDEKKAIKARDRFESMGWEVRLVKVFDHHLKDREAVVKKKKVKTKERKVPDLIPEGTRNIVLYVRPGDLIISELGIGVNYKGKITDGITRLVINDRGKAVPIIIDRPINTTDEEKK